jgi:SAM-dependent methyltransferase
MAHAAQAEFCRSVKGRFPDYFRRQRVLDVGALDLNGNNKILFEGCAYTGIDIGEGPNVDVVSVAHEYPAPSESFDVIISTECLEHDRHYPETLRNIVRMLRPGGLFLFTCATTGRSEHGTVRSDQGCNSPLTIRVPGWENYYKNIAETDVREAIPVDEIFEPYQFVVNEPACDLYFWGFKREGLRLSGKRIAESPN